MGGSTVYIILLYNILILYFYTWVKVHVPRILVELHPHFALSILSASTPHFLFWLLPLDSAHFPFLAVMESVAAQNARTNSSHCLITQLSCGHCLEKGQALSKTPEHFCRTLSLAADL